MTLLIAYLLLGMIEAEPTAYMLTFILWILHLAYHERKK